MSRALPGYEAEWRSHLSDLLGLPLSCIPHSGGSGTAAPRLPAESSGGGGGAAALRPQRPASRGFERKLSSMLQPLATQPSLSSDVSGGEAMLQGLMDASLLVMEPVPSSPHDTDRQLRTVGSFVSRRGSATAGGAVPRVPSTASMGGGGTFAPQRPASAAAMSPTGAGLLAISGAATGSVGGAATSGGGGAHCHPQQKASLATLCVVLREFVSLYGPVVVLLENLHDFDTWSWQLLVKAAEELGSAGAGVLLVATTRPNTSADVGPSGGGSSVGGGGLGPAGSPGSGAQQLHGKAAMYQRAAALHRQLLALKTTTSILLGPFNFQQTKELMQVERG